MKTERPYAIGSYCSSIAWAGLEMNVLRFLRWMKERGWETVAYAAPDTKIYESAIETGQLVRPIRSGFRYGDIVNARRLAKQMAKDNVRILSLHQSSDMFLGVLAKMMAPRDFKLIYSQHMHIGANKKDFFHSWEYRKFDAWITPVEWLAERVMEKTVVSRDRIHVVPRGIELDRFMHNRPTKADARERLDLPVDIKLAGIVGRLDVKKCQDTVIRAMKRVHDQGQKLHLAIIGAKTRGEETGYAEEIHRLVKELGLSDFVHFRPHLKQQEFGYAALDMFVLPSESETYGMVTVEALASGLPVIATAAGGTLSQISEGDNGLLYPPHDDEALAECLMRLLLDNSLTKRLTEQAEKDALRLYSHTGQCEGWESVFEKIAPE
ncbi:MAG: glycosyltransferase family 4 protein [candidate division Zixibacteria bacterium]